MKSEIVYIIIVFHVIPPPLPPPPPPSPPTHPPQRSICIQTLNVSDPYSVHQVMRLRLMGAPGITHELCSYPAVLSSSIFPS